MNVDFFVNNTWAVYVVLAIVAAVLAIFFFIIGKSVGRRIGNGKVISQPLPISQQLEAGVMYTCYASEKDGGGVISSINTIGGEYRQFFATRTMEKLPENFAIFDDVVVEIKPPESDSAES